VAHDPNIHRKHPIVSERSVTRLRRSVESPRSAKEQRRVPDGTAETLSFCRGLLVVLGRLIACSASSASQGRANVRLPCWRCVCVCVCVISQTDAWTLHAPNRCCEWNEGRGCGTFLMMIIRPVCGSLKSAMGVSSSTKACRTLARKDSQQDLCSCTYSSMSSSSMLRA
jgi:hypothetical protein